MYVPAFHSCRIVDSYSHETDGAGSWLSGPIQGQRFLEIVLFNRYDGGSSGAVQKIPRKDACEETGTEK